MITATPPEIRFGADQLRNDQFALEREWLVTNGIGGYASSSLSTANTRRYHGILVAAMSPPVGRAVLLSKLEETIDVTDAAGVQSPTIGLSTNVYQEALYPIGHRLLQSWSSNPCPTWVWSPLPGIRVEKRIWMPEGRNVTCVRYQLLDSPAGAKASLHIVPLVAWKDYHSEQHAQDSYPGTVWLPPSPAAEHLPETPRAQLHVTLPAIPWVTQSSVELAISVRHENGVPFDAVDFDAQSYWYYRFQHPREQERGQDFQEDLCAIGMFTITLALGEAIVLEASCSSSGTQPQGGPPTVDTHSADSVRENVAASIVGAPAAPDEFGELLACAADAFLIDAPGVRSTIIAGYPWFCDWGRDTMIALPGLCISTGKLEIARKILVSFAAFVDEGMLPNRFPDGGSAPEYNTVDAILWYFIAIYRYVEASGDVDVLRETLWPVMQATIDCWMRGTRFNIHIDPRDQLYYAGQQGVQLTWMDARIGDWVVTPRIGKPVEINALWHSILKIMSHFADKVADTEVTKRYDDLAATVAANFETRFVRPDGRGLFDVVDAPPDNHSDGSIRPNQIFALCLPFPVIDISTDIAKRVFSVVHDELWTAVGLRTLSPRDSNYRPRYEGDGRSRDSAYHQGTAWPWLLGPFAEAYYRVHADRDGARGMLVGLRDQLSVYGVGSLAEVYDGSDPQRPNGCIAQAWSIGEVLRVWKLLEG